MKIEHIAVALGGLAVVAYFLLKSNTLGGGGGGGGGDTITADPSPNANGDTTAKKDAGTGDAGTGTDSGAAIRKILQNAGITVIGGPGGNVPGAFGIMGAPTGGEREQQLATAESTGQLFGTSGDIYNPVAGDILTQYAIDQTKKGATGGYGLWLVPVGSGGAVTPEYGTLSENAGAGSWTIVSSTGQVEAAGGLAALGSIEGTPQAGMIVKKGTLTATGTITPLSSAPPASYLPSTGGGSGTGGQTGSGGSMASALATWGSPSSVTTKKVSVGGGQTTNVYIAGLSVKGGK